MSSTEIARQDPGSGSLMERIAEIGVPAKLAENYIALNPESDVLDVVIENMGGDFEDIDLTKLPRMKFPTGGDTTFNVPDATNENGSRQVKRITAIMVVSQQRRAFWPSVDITGNPPTCFALDGRNGQGEFGKNSKRNPTGKCSKCPMSNYGTKAELEGARDDAQGQACKQTRLLYLLMPGAALPMQLSVPPASLKIINEYLMNLAAVGTPTPFYGVEVELSLNQVTGATSPYAQLVASTTRVLEGEELAVTKVYARTLKAMLDEAGASTLAQEVSDAEPEGDPEGGYSFGGGGGEAATEGGFEDVENADEGSNGQEAASAGAGKSRSGSKA